MGHGGPRAGSRQLGQAAARLPNTAPLVLPDTRGTPAGPPPPGHPRDPRLPAHDLVGEEDPAHLWVLVLTFVDDGLGGGRERAGGVPPPPGTLPVPCHRSSLSPKHGPSLGDPSQAGGPRWQPGWEQWVGEGPGGEPCTPPSLCPRTRACMAACAQLYVPTPHGTPAFVPVHRRVFVHVEGCASTRVPTLRTWVCAYGCLALQPPACVCTYRRACLARPCVRTCVQMCLLCTAACTRTDVPARHAHVCTRVCRWPWELSGRWGRGLPARPSRQPHAVTCLDMESMRRT